MFLAGIHILCWMPAKNIPVKRGLNRAPVKRGLNRAPVKRGLNRMLA